MAESTIRPIEVSDAVSDPVYRPVSVLAIVGLAVAILYAVIILVGALMSFQSGSPLLLGPLVSVGLPLLAALLCLLAWWQIARSEGTRAGRPMAVWGLWLSVIFGLSYYAFYSATYFAIRTDADDYTMRWFELLKKNKLNHAFLHTMEPGMRQSVDPDNDRQMEIRFNPAAPDQSRQGPLTVFRQSELARFIGFSGDDLKITPLGVREWDFAAGRHRIKRIYLLSNSEGSSEVTVVCLGSASTKGEYEGREWMVNWLESSFGQQRLTPLGQRLGNLRGQSADFVARWCDKLDRGKVDEAALDLFEPGERLKRWTVYVARAILLNSLTPTSVAEGFAPASAIGRVVAFTEPEFVVKSCMPNFQSAVDNLVKLDPNKPFRSDDETSRQTVLSGLQTLYQPTRAKHKFRSGIPMPNAKVIKPVEVEGNRIQLTHEFFLGFLPRQQLTAKLTVVSAPGWDQPNYQGGWRLVGLEPIEAQDMTKAKSRTAPNRPMPTFKTIQMDSEGKAPPAGATKPP